MTVAPELDRELADAAKALGLLGSDGALDPSWFEHPLDHLRGLLKDATQRQAFVDLVDALLPPDGDGAAPAGERWHPLLHDSHPGNVYLTVRGDGSGPVAFGVAAAAHGPQGAGAGDLSATIAARVPLVESAAGLLRAIAGTTDGPIALDLRVAVHWMRPAEAIGLEAVRVSASLSGLDVGGPQVSLRIVLERLDLGDGDVREEVPLDPSEIGSEAAHVVVALLRQRLHLAVAQGGLPAEVATLADTLVETLGLDPASPVPRLPIDRLLSDPAVLRDWLSSLTQGGSAASVAQHWLEQLTKLVSGTAASATGTGTPSDPFRVPVIGFSAPASGGVELVLTRVEDAETHVPSLEVSIGVSAAPAAAAKPARLEASVTVASVPLSGAVPARVLPRIDVVARAPGDSSRLHGAPTDVFSVGALVGGLSWNGSSVLPRLELLDVVFAGQRHARVDLTNADSVADVGAGAGAAALTAALDAALGTTGAGRRVAVLLGLADPAGAAGWPASSRAAPAAFAANPIAEIGRIHRAVLADATHTWAAMLSELAALAGVGGAAPAVAGTGTPGDPWRVQLASQGALSFDLAAWNDTQPPSAGQPQRLRIGIRLGADRAPLHAGWTLALAAFDLPPSAPVAARLIGGMRLGFDAAPLPAPRELAGVRVRADGFRIGLDWTAGAALRGGATIQNLVVEDDTDTVAIPALRFPPAAAGTATNPLAGYGVTDAEAEALLRLAVRRAASAWGGVEAQVLGSLAGLFRGLDDLPADWPTLAGGPAALLRDPETAFRDLLRRLLTTASSDGRAFAEDWLEWLLRMLADALPAFEDELEPGGGLEVEGLGTRDEPWALPLSTAAPGTVEALVWLEPGGPPGPLAVAATTAVGQAVDFPHLVDRLRPLAPFVPDVATVFDGRNGGEVAAGLAALAEHLTTTDGLVPVASQGSTAPGWTVGATRLREPHARLPSDPQAIGQIRTQIAAWAPQAVLLLSPPFGSRGNWQVLLAAAEADAPGSTDSGAHFDFRRPGVPPSSADLGGVTAAVRWYTADLADPGSADQTAVADQIGRAVARIRELHGGGAAALVGHSTAGVAARQLAATAPAGTLAGLVTLGAPLLGAPLLPLTDPAVADAVRIVRRLVPTPLADARLEEAIALLERALDGYLPSATAGAPPEPAPFPAASFTGSADLSLGAVPGLALVGELQVDLLAALRNGIAARGGAVDGGRIPTHVGLGLRADLALPGAGRDGPIAVDADVRVDLTRVRLPAAATAEPSTPLRRVVVRARLSRPGGWLVGDPGADVRARLATFACAVEPRAGGLVVTPDVRLEDAALRGVARDASLSDAIAPGVIGAALRAISAPAPSVGGAVDVLLDALARLGVAVPDPHEGTGFSLDGLTALAADPRGYLGPRLAAALDSPGGLLGLAGPAGGPWTLDSVGGSLELSVARDPWLVRLRTLDGGLQLAGPTLSLDAALDLAAARTDLDATLRWGPVRIELSQPAGRLRIAAEPWLGETDLLPASAAGDAALETLAPRLLLSAALGALLERTVGPELAVLPVDALLSDPGGWLSGAHAFGARDAGGAPVPGLDAARLTELLNGLAAAAGLPAGAGIVLPGDLEVSVTGRDPLVASVATRTPINGVLTVAATASIDALRHVTPGGTVGLTVPLPAGAGWSSVTITAGTSAEGLTLAVAPSGQPPIQLLPRFSGFGALAAAATALLPAILDELRAALGPTPASRSRLMQLALDLCTALDLYDEAGGFAAHAAAIRTVGRPGWLEGLGATARTAAAARIADVLSDPASSLRLLPGTLAVDGAGPRVDWSWTPPGASGSLGVRLGWHGAGPEVGLRAAGLKLSGSPVTIDLGAGLLDGALEAGVALALDAGAALGFPFQPRVQAELSGGRFALRVVPVAPLEIELAPTPRLVGGVPALEALAREWLLPLAANLALEAARGAAGSPLGKRLFSGGKTVEEVLKAAGILDAAGRFQVQLPSLPVAIRDALGALAGLGVDIGPQGELRLEFVDAGRVGVRLRGHEEISAGDYALSVRFGDASWIGSDGGVKLYLLDVSGALPRLRPGLEVVGLGASLARNEDAPLVDTSAFRLGAADVYLFLDLELDGGVHVASIGGGVELEKVSIPLGQAASAPATSNPVASSLLGPGGGAGDQQHAAPSVDVVAYKRDADLTVLIEGQTGPIWIPVHRHFGPLYLDEIGLDRTADPGAELLLDAGVQIGPLTAQVDDLTVAVPFAALLDPSRWRLDLKGLAVGFSTTGVRLAGGLVKSQGAVVEYDGMLMVQVATFGFTAVGSYARPSDAQGGYTSFFVFVALPITIGGPPFLFVTGLGGGLGLNRELHPPQDLNRIPDFLFVRAIDDDSLANDPMGALLQIRGSIPPARGAFWIAAGLRFTTFVLLHSTAVVYVALQNGVEVGVLGVSRMALPKDDVAIVSVELALKARYSTAESLLSVQAQLTDNSWLFSRDCQLTGGFAFFMWFRESQFVLTVGGYHPHFQKPDRFPDVPRLGFHWQVSDALVVKGESYFALTNSCVMAGGRLEASFHSGGLRAWLTAYADILVAWDPFGYEVDVGVSVGVGWHGRVCFFFCATIDISVSVGARLHLEGPPLHGSVTVEYWFISVTIPFGDDRVEIPYIQQYSAFADKYLVAGDPDRTCVGLRVTGGLLPPDPPGAQPAPGSRDQPWRLAAEFALASETRLPAHSYDDLLGSGRTSSGVGRFDLAPMAKSSVETVHGIRLTGRDGAAVSVDAAHWAFNPILGWVPDATWRFVDPHHVQPAAGKLRAITGLEIVGKAVAQGPSATIPWATLVDDSIVYARPLPIAPNDALTQQLVLVGAAADALIALAADEPHADSGKLVESVLAGATTSARDRRELGLPRPPAGALTIRSVRRDRSAPPLVQPLAEGMTQKPVGLAAAPKLASRPAAEPLLLNGPRLRAVLQARPRPVAPVQAARRTSVAGLAGAEDAPRLAPPRLAQTAGARLVRVPATSAPRPTTAAVGTRTLTTPETGAQAPADHAAELDRLTKEALGDGAELAAGATQVWELPGELAENASVEVAGEAAARVSCVSASGELVHDVEGVATTVPIPAGTDTVVVTCLGRAPDGLGSGPGAISAHAAAPGRIAATGWQTGGHVHLVSAARALCRGGGLALPTPFVPRANEQRTTQAVVRLDPALAAAKGVETWLPIGTDVVMVMLEEADAEAAAAGDVAIAAEGATLAAPPLVVFGGRRRALLYEVADREDGERLSVAVGSVAGWRLAGVVGLAGRAEEWAARFAGGVPEQLVPEGPLTPDGSVRLRLVGIGEPEDHDPLVLGVAPPVSQPPAGVPA